ncbi:MAG: hypothetical protein HYT72_00490 [Candidatus Aenigmarchaeota archaeon]|nr:hypothetical protein [Candidatus Aenigmarchaeota archaeon]
MGLKEAVRHPRIILWIVFVALSLLLISPNPSPRGVIITSVGKNISSDLSAGDIIYAINGKEAKDALAEKFSGTIKIETNKGTRFIKVNGTLPVETKDVPPTRLNFGLDLVGGIRAVIDTGPNITQEYTDQILSTLQTRINVFGLKESAFRPVEKRFIEISIAGGNKEELKELLERQGKFEAKIPFSLPVKNGVASLDLDKKYSISVKNSSSSVEIGQATYQKGESFILASIPFEFHGVYENRLNLTSTVFTSDDIKFVFFSPEKSRIEKKADGYNWFFVIQISNMGARKFAQVTKNIPVVVDYLESKIYLYLDSNVIDALNIASNLKGSEQTEISITGGAANQQEAVKEKARLQSILRSGSLPASIEIVQIDTISPNLGLGFLQNTLVAGLAALLGVASVILIRYRSIRFVLPMLAVSFSEVIMILGMSVLIGSTIDLPAIAGIIAAIGTGVDSQIVMLDQALRKEVQEYTLREKLKRAFFIIFGSGGTIIAAMIPLLFLGLGVLRGFAITTIIGVLVGILIARPAFGIIIERIVKE